jgi:hypothetical protein
VIAEISEKLAVMCGADQTSSFVEASITGVDAKRKAVI